MGCRRSGHMQMCVYICLCVCVCGEKNADTRPWDQQCIPHHHTHTLFSCSCCRPKGGSSTQVGAGRSGSTGAPYTAGLSHGQWLGHGHISSTLTYRTTEGGVVPRRNFMVACTHLTLLPSYCRTVASCFFTGWVGGALCVNIEKCSVVEPPSPIHMETHTQPFPPSLMHVRKQAMSCIWPWFETVSRTNTTALICTVLCAAEEGTPHGGISTALGSNVCS